MSSLRCFDREHWGKNKKKCSTCKYNDNKTSNLHLTVDAKQAPPPYLPHLLPPEYVWRLLCFLSFTQLVSCFTSTNASMCVFHRERFCTKTNKENSCFCDIFHDYISSWLILCRSSSVKWSASISHDVTAKNLSRLKLEYFHTTESPRTHTSEIVV